MCPDRSRVLVAARVPCEPAEAFARFTNEIGHWWQSNPLFRSSEGRNAIPADHAARHKIPLATFQLRFAE